MIPSSTHAVPAIIELPPSIPLLHITATLMRGVSLEVDASGVIPWDLPLLNTGLQLSELGIYVKAQQLDSRSGLNVAMDALITGNVTISDFKSIDTARAQFSDWNNIQRASTRIDHKGELNEVGSERFNV